MIGPFKYLVIWTMPRRLLAQDLASMVEERKELREAVVRHAIEREVLRANLALLERRLVEEERRADELAQTLDAEVAP